MVFLGKCRAHLRGCVYWMQAHATHLCGQEERKQRNSRNSWTDDGSFLSLVLWIGGRPIMKASDDTSVVHLFRRLTETGERPLVDVVLRECCAHFQADAIGVSSVENGESDLVFASAPQELPSLPWKTSPELLGQFLNSLGTETHSEPAGAWLVNAVGGLHGEGVFLVWVYRSGKRAWTESERSQWSIASQALVRWCSQAMAKRWANAAQTRRLENATAITAKLSHDFGNYLTGILGFTELSLSQTPTESPAYKFLQEVLQSAHQGAAWIRRLHLFCRQGGAVVWPTRFATVLALEESRLRSAETSKMRWEAKLPGDLPLLEIDADALQIVLQELIKNAQDATRNSGTITFSARPVELTRAECAETLGALQPGANVEISISDDGPGIAPRDRDKLFRDLFYSTKPRGRGVGLLVVYGILKRYRGGLRVDAVEPGPGVCVRLLLPATAVAGPPISDGDAKRRNVLLAHANPVVFDSVRVLLEARGCKVTAADSPQTALSAYTAPKASFSLVVVDVTMPQLSGFDFARRILDHDSDANFLFVYTQPSFHGVVEEQSLKRFELLRFPLQPATLLRAVQSALARPS